MTQKFDKNVPYESYSNTPGMLAYEAFSRGIELKITNSSKSSNGISIRAINGETSYSLTHACALTTRKAIRICTDKHKTREYLEKSGVSTPKGVEVRGELLKEELQELVNGLNYPLVLKPSHGIKGAGVITNIFDFESLYLNYKKQPLVNETGYVIEEQIDGEEYRVFVLGDAFLSAVKRVPPVLQGDGFSSIEELIKSYNVARNLNLHLRIHLIKFNDTLNEILRDQDLSLSSVPKSGETFFVSYAGNFSAGGRSVDCTDTVSDELKTTCVGALKAIPGLGYSGIDVIERKDGKAFIIELNHNPSIGSNHFPEIGSGVDVAGAVIDSYFPNVEKEEHKVYFDLKKARNLLKKSSITSLSVKLPANKRGSDLKLKRIVFRGKVQGVGFRKYIKKMALGNNIDGFVRNLNSGDVEIYLAATDNDLDKLIDQCRKGNGRSMVEEVIVNESNRIVFEGFSIEKTI